MMKYLNYFKMTIPALSRNESFARTAVSAFVTQLDPLVSQLSDIRAAVSEAVTNCIVHAYKEGDKAGKISITAKISEDRAYIRIKDTGCGMEDIKQAMEPLSSKKNKGTTVSLTFIIEQRDVL